MADEPKDVAELGAALDKAFAWLAGTWEEDAEKTWADLRGDFVAKLDFTDAAAHPVVRDFTAHVDGLTVGEEEDQQYDLLVDKEERDKVLAPLIEDWAQTHHWDGDRWLVWNADANEWLTEDGASPDAEEPAEADTDAAAAAGDETEEDTKRDDPSAVAGDVVGKILIPAIDSAIGDDPALAVLSPDDRRELVTRLLAEQLAKVS